MSDLVKLLRESFVAYSPKGRKVRSFRVREDIMPGDRERIADELERLERENDDLRAERDNFQNNGIEVAKQLIKERDEACGKLSKQCEILQDVLSDCYLTDGMRLEIERLISIKEVE